MKRRPTLFALLLLCATLVGGCFTPVLEDYTDEKALTANLPVDPSNKAIDIPKVFFDDTLPGRFQNNGIGIINDQDQFQKLWNLYAKDATALPPSIDFQENFVLFVYDPEYYNLIRIIGVNVWQGVANPIIEKTKWTLPLEGDPMMHKIRQIKGEKMPEIKVNAALLQLPRNRKGAPGITAIMAGDTYIKVPRRP